MLENLATPVVAIALILGITFPIWLLVLFVRLVRNVGRIADEVEAFTRWYVEHASREAIERQRKVS